MLATKNITPDTKGKLISTTSMEMAGRLNRMVKVKSLLQGRPAHYELTNNSVIIYTFNELFELAI